MKPVHLLFILIAGVSIACSSGKQAYEKGNYYEAVVKAVGRLRQNPDHEKSQEALQNAYPLAIEYYEQQASNEMASNSPYKYKNAIQAYNTINQLYEAIKTCPGCLKVIKNPVNHYAEIAPLKEKAAEIKRNRQQWM